MYEGSVLVRCPLCHCNVNDCRDPEAHRDAWLTARQVEAEEWAEYADMERDEHPPRPWLAGGGNAD